MRNIITIFLLVFMLYNPLSAQEIINREQLTYSLGFGREHAGYGLNILYYHKNKNLGIFGAVGYPVVGFSYNVGIKYRFYSTSQRSRFIPYCSLIYGYHKSFSTISQTNDGKYNKTILGSSISVGLDTGPKVSKKVYLSIGINYGFNNKEAEDYEKFLKSLGYDRRSRNEDFYIPVSWPFSFSFGLRFILN